MVIDYNEQIGGVDKSLDRVKIYSLKWWHPILFQDHGHILGDFLRCVL